MSAYDKLTIVDQFEERTNNRAAVQRACNVMLQYLAGLKRPLPAVAAQALAVAQQYKLGSPHVASLREADDRIGQFLKGEGYPDAGFEGAVSAARATQALLKLLQEPVWGGGASEALSNFLEWVDEFEQDHSLFEQLLTINFEG